MGSKGKKVKVVPLHSTEVLLGDRRYSSYSFLTSALEGGEWSASHPGRALPPGKEPRYPLYRRLGGPQSRSGCRGLEEKFCASVMDRTPAVQSVVRYCTDWATPAPSNGKCTLKIKSLVDGTLPFLMPGFSNKPPVKSFYYWPTS
jgi:hypothetical protein